VPQPKILKTDNGPGYASASFKQFYAQMGIKHITGIPYNPQGQGIVKRTHQTLKNMLFKLQSGGKILYLQSGNSKMVLNHALFVLNFLTYDNAGKSAADRLWHPSTANNYAQAMWETPCPTNGRVQTQSSYGAKDTLASTIQKHNMLDGSLST
jgi:transposase InsO family protein